MLAATQLVEDVVHIILDSDDRWWPRDLAQLARVSSVWLRPIQQRLYACPTLNSFHACSLLARTLSTNTSLAALLQGIDIRPVKGDDHRTESTHGEEPASLRYLLGLCGLQKLGLGGEMAVHAEIFLHTLADTDSIQELCIDGSMLADSIQTQPSLEWDETIAFRFPNLRKLKLVHLELDIIHPTIPCQMGITDLVIENVWITSGYLPYLLHETTSLERFSVVGKTSSDLDEHVRLVLEAYPIQCLHYEVQDARSGTQPIFTQDTPTLSSLRTLHLDGVRMDLEMMEILSRCCSQLEDFSVSGRMIHLASRDWAMLIRAGTFPALRDLSLPLGTNVPPFLTWTQAERASIINECRIRQIGVMGL